MNLKNLIAKAIFLNRGKQLSCSLAADNDNVSVAFGDFSADVNIPGIGTFAKNFKEDVMSERKRDEELDALTRTETIKCIENRILQEELSRLDLEERIANAKIAKLRAEADLKKAEEEYL